MPDTPATRASLVIAVGGGSASGKSTLSDALRRDIGQARILRQDAYYLPELSADSNFDEPAAIEWSLLEAHLVDLRAGRSVAVPIYDFSTHRRLVHRTDRLDPEHVVIVEGLHVLGRDRLQPLWDLALFVDAPADLRLMRRVRRDTTERGRTIDSVLQQYEDQVRPMHQTHVEPTRPHADQVLDGTRTPGDNVAIIRALAQTRGLSIW